MTEQGAEQSVLEGAVSSLIFQNEENGYTILRLDVGEEEMTVVGSMPGVSPGEYLTVRGQWVRHATYGVQFRADVVERRLPQGMKEIYHYLASGAVKGVGKATARLLIEEFGEDALRVMEEEPEKLTRLRGVSPKRARSISEAFRKQMGMRRLLEFLSEHQLPMELSSRLFRAYGDVALEVVRSNPYVLAAGEFGVDFSQADALALSLGVAADDPQRLEAGLLFELSHNNWNNGHTFLPAQKLVGATAQLLECREEQLEERLEALAVRGEVDLDQVAGQEAVYLPALYEAETYIAQRMGEMSRAELLPPDGLDRLLKQIQRAQGITYAPQQLQAVRQAAQRQVMLLTGGPGTGKTTCLRGGAHCPSHRDLPPGGPERHRPKCPHGKLRGAARPAAERQRLLLPAAAGSPVSGGDHCGPVPPAAAGAHGDPRRPDPGPLPHPAAGHRDRGAEPGPPGRPQSPGGAEGGAPLRRLDLPGGGPGDAGQEQLRHPLAGGGRDRLRHGDVQRGHRGDPHRGQGSRPGGL